MLVLSRKKNESIVINDNITVVIVDVRGDKVRLGVDAPSDVTVHRKEVFDAIAKESYGESGDKGSREINNSSLAIAPMLVGNSDIVGDSALAGNSGLGGNSGSATAVLELPVGIQTEARSEKSTALDRNLRPRTKPIAKKTFKKK